MVHCCGLVMLSMPICSSFVATYSLFRFHLDGYSKQFLFFSGLPVESKDDIVPVFHDACFCEQIRSLTNAT